MRKAIALALGTLLPVLGLSGIGQAQSSVQVQGTIQAVDCQAQTVVLSGPSTSNTIATAPYTAVLVNSTSVPFCALQQYIGAPATAWLLASGNEFVATRIDVVGQVAVVSPPPTVVVAPSPTLVAAPLPIVDIVLGTIVVAGLVYLLVRDHDGHYYRYPYYGPYYRYYYRPEYQPYVEPYPALAPIIIVPSVIVGVVLGTVVVGGFEYLVVRDHDGRFYRYPYYGPYHRYYYRPEHRPYYGPHHDAPVRQGDPRWDARPSHEGHNQGGPEYHDPGDRVPVQRGAPPRWTPPADQGAPAYHNPTWNPPAHQNERRRDVPGYRDPGTRVPVQRGTPPQWTPPDNQGAPAYHTPTWNPPAHQNDRRRDAPGYRQPHQRCEATILNQPCGDDRGSPHR